MLRLVLIVQFLCLCLITFAQLDYSLEPVPAYADTTADAESFRAHAMIKNLSEETIVIAWQRITNNIPNTWQSYICSNITCAPPDVSMGTFSLTAHDSTNFDCYFKPDGLPGNGMVELRLFLTDDTTQVIFASYFGNAIAVSTTDPILDQIKIYPNPAEDYILIENPAPLETEIYSSQGILVASYQEVVQELDISTLPSGIYFLRLYNLKTKQNSITRFQKLN